MADLALIFIVEKGPLEQQALLLAESVKAFCGNGLSIDMFACCVREACYPTAPALRKLEALGAHILCENLNQEHSYFPLCNGIYAAAHIERHFPQYSGHMLVDTDTVFLNGIPASLLAEPMIMMRPVDNQGIGSQGRHDANDPFWQAAFRLFDLPLPPADMQTTVRPATIRPYFNSGFVLSYQLGDFMQQWQQDFTRLMDSPIRTQGDASRYGKDYGFIEQFTLSITQARYAGMLRLAPATINYPIPFRPLLQQRPEHADFIDLIHVHYHRWFRHPGFLEHVTEPLERSSAQYAWLQQRLPLEPQIDGEFKC